MYTQVFRDGDRSSQEGLSSYLEQVYFDNPWVDDEFPSLVSEQGGVINGFLGVMPRWMQYRGEAIRVAVSSALMVRVEDSGQRNPITGVSLLRRFLEGKQDVSLTDTANEIGADSGPLAAVRLRFRTAIVGSGRCDRSVPVWR